MYSFYFSQNPISLSVLGEYDSLLVDIFVFNYYSNSLVYRTRKTSLFYNSVARVDVSDIAASVCEMIGCPNANAALLRESRVAIPLKFELHTYGHLNDDEGYEANLDVYTFHVLPGGISNTAHRRFTGDGESVFDNYLADINPFLTNSKIIRLTDSTMAVCPLYVFTLSTDVKLRITYKDLQHNDAVFEYAFATLSDGIRSIGLKTLLDDLAQEVGWMPRLFKLEVVADDNIPRGLYVAIEEKPATPQLRVMLWRNSWGVFEATQLNGQATKGIEVAKEEFLTYSFNSDSYTAKRLRGEMKVTGTATTGYRTKEELDHLLELYASDEHHLVNEDGSLTEVVLTSTTASLNLDVNEPQEHTLEWKVAEVETKITKL